MSEPLAFISADEVFARCPPARAAAAVEDALRSGLDPSGDTARLSVAVEHGHLLLMPSGAHEGFRTPGIDHVGMKVAAVAPGNPGKGLPRIQASYLLLDARTLTVRAVLDGTALTTLRTPAVSVAAIRAHLSRGDGPLSVAVIGSGPQALGHAVAFDATIGSQRPCRFQFLVRDPIRASRTVPSTFPIVRLGSTDADELLRTADAIVCATSAQRPLFDGAMVADHAVVVAVGSHEPEVREVDAALCRRSTVVVEDRATALREAGDVVLAVEDGAVDPDDLVPMAELVTGRTTAPTDRPLLFKSVGMSWEDLVVASAVFSAEERR